MMQEKHHATRKAASSSQTPDKAPIPSRPIKKQSLSSSARTNVAKPNFRGETSHTRRVAHRRSKLGQFVDASAFWQELVQQAVNRAPLKAYVYIKTIETGPESLTRMSIRSNSQDKAELLRIAVQKSGRGKEQGELEQLKTAEAAAFASIQHFAGTHTDILTIRSYHDHMKNHTMNTALKLKLGNILGRGGNAIVMQVSAADRFTQTILGTQKLALKLLYAERYRTPTFTEDDYLQLFQEEIRVESLPVQYAAKSGKFDSSTTLNDRGGFLTLKFSSEFSPYIDGEVVLCDGYVFYSRIMLFERMLIDVRSLVLPCPALSKKYNMQCSILTMDERIYIAKQMLIRVAAFHSLGLTHYDIKPANFLISSKGKVVLSDFGFATPVGTPVECGSNCTPKYQDPENAACSLASQISTRDFEFDAWGLGLSMYYVLTNGEYPYNLNRKHNIIQGLADFVHQDPQEMAFLKGITPWQALERLGVPNYLIQSITLLLQARRRDRPTPLKLLSMYSEYINGE